MRSMSLVLPLLVVACAIPSTLPDGARIGEPIEDREIETLVAIFPVPPGSTSYPGDQGTHPFSLQIRPRS